MVRFPADYCLSVCATSTLQGDGARGSLESMLGLADCHRLDEDHGDADARPPSPPHETSVPTPAYDTSIVEDVINSALKEQSEIHELHDGDTERLLADVELAAATAAAATRGRKLEESLRLTDTSVVEAVLSTFALPECEVLPPTLGQQQLPPTIIRTPPSESKAEPDSTGCDPPPTSDSLDGVLPDDEDDDLEMLSAKDQSRHVGPPVCGRRCRTPSYRVSLSTRKSAIDEQVEDEGEALSAPVRGSAIRGRRGRSRRRVSAPRRGNHALASPSSSDACDGASSALGRSSHTLAMNEETATQVTLSAEGDAARGALQPDSTRLSPAGSSGVGPSDAFVEAYLQAPATIARGKRGRRNTAIAPLLLPSTDTSGSLDSALLEDAAVMPPTLDRALPTGRARGRRRRAPVLAPLPPPVLPSPAPEADEAVIPLADPAAESPFSPAARTRRRGRDASLLLDSNASDTAAAFDPDPAAVATAPASETTHGIPTSSAPTQPPVSTVTSSSTAPIHTSTTTITISGRRVSRKRKMDYAEIIEPLEKADHRSDEERAMAPAPASVKAKRAKKLLSAKFIKIDKLERTDASKHDKTDKSEKSEKLIFKQEKKKRVKESSRDRSPAVINPSPHPTNISSPVHKAVTTAESGARTSTESAVDTSSIDKVVTPRVSSGRATPAENASRGESLETSVRSKDFDSVSRTKNVDVSCIRDCYVILNHIDVTQYLKKSRPGEEPGNETTEEAGNVDREASQDYWDVETIQSCVIAATVPPASPPQPLPPTPRDPTQEIESQLALLEEMSNHLTATRESNGDETSRVGAVAASPACDEESTASVDVPSDSAAPPVPLPPPPSVSYSTSVSKRPRLEEPSPRLAPSTPASSCGGQTPEDFDKDSVSSSDIGTQDGGDSPNKQTTKRKPRKRKHRADAVEHITFEAHRGPVLDVKTVGRHVLAACEDGSVYCYSLKSGKLKRQYCGHSAAVICLSILVREGPGGEDPVPEFLFTGSLDHHLRCFQFKTGTLVNQPVNLGKPIQCMDENWGTIFIGTKMGEVAKFYTKSFKLNEEYIRCSKDSILAIKATKEGARKVVIVAARNEPVTIRDANSGLLMRVVGHNLPHTVYSLLLEQSLLYCGTKTGKIPVFSFTSGEEVGRYSAGYGVVCMRVYNQLLFAGCYDGNIYIYSTQDKSLISCIPGPGKMLLCLDVVKNRIIAGSKDNKLQAWPLPTVVKNCIRESRHR